MESQASTGQVASEGVRLSRSGARNLSEQSQRVLEDVRELGHVALESAGEAAGQMRERGSAALEAGKERANAAKGQFDKVVGDNPMKSVLIALGVGAVLGYALRRR